MDPYLHRIQIYPDLSRSIPDGTVLLSGSSIQYRLSFQGALRSTVLVVAR
eukprot:COSAG02_NODE_15574_length_1159_cov_1.099057_1_plen_49_part_10